MRAPFGWDIRLKSKVMWASPPPHPPLGFFMSVKPCRHTRPHETVFPDLEILPKQTGAVIPPKLIRGCDHVAAHSQCDLSPVSSGRPSRLFKPGSEPMIEIVTALTVFLSIAIFLAHAFDAYRMR